MKNVHVVVTTIGLEWTKKCLPDLWKNTLYPYKLHLVDDCTNEESEKYLNDFYKTYQSKTLQNSELFFTDDFDGFGCQDIIITTSKQRRAVSGCWNVGINKALEDNADYVVILNNDIQFPDTKAICWLGKLIAFYVENPNYGWVSPAWYWTGHEDDSIQRYKNSCWDYMKQHEDTMEEGGLGCFFVLNMDVVRKLKTFEEQDCENENFPGLFDAVSYPTQWEEVDYILRLRRYNFHTAVIHKVALFHWGSAYLGSNEWQPTAKREYDTGHRNFKDKWRSRGYNIPDSTFRVTNGRYSYNVNGDWNTI